MTATSPIRTSTSGEVAHADLAMTASNAQSHHSSHNHKHHSGANAAIIEYGYPHGHLGHLTAEEDKSFKEFKQYLIKEGVYKPGPPPSHDDATLLRFLRARRWVVLDGYKQFKETEDWRAATQLNLLYDTIDLDGYEQSRLLYPQWTGRRDKRGIPVYLFEICHLDSKTISTYEKTTNNTYSKAKPDGNTPPRLLRLFALYENLTRFAQPLCTQMPDREHATITPITLSTNIVDVSGVSLRQFWNLKSHMQAASTLATAHYPETLDRIFIIGAPVFFTTVWGWVKRWFDPVTVSKIFILGPQEVLPTLLSFIAKKDIPKKYGGELDFTWGQMPNLDPAIRARTTWENDFTDFPKGPLFWRPIDGGRVECVAAGSVKKVERMARVCTMPTCFKGAAAVVPEEVTGAIKPVVASSSNGHVDAVDAETVAKLEGLTVTEKADATPATVTA
ncbi:cellular retinaldehyde-binding/triple function protein [Grosmannia clavigera kw1407]|uniref:Cellular retinaldehyde-binding/triple function protein n=1 Tax=Grosmannia clavigera (strain kw1407 / UAMH 11150) TaxID=655863 RepID=F0X814_GROCL|nr:cellular retinaldehyde-binding/triple function protein [Grosmannia clavigera kw1407]EFX06001.1 cellular retinaldehyde-binding/triple function protein [Grosmannia clavigera kw1407]